MKNFATILLLLSIFELSGQWTELGGVNSLSEYQNIRSICSDKAGNIYAAGTFTNLPSTGFNISKWNGQAWSKLAGLVVDDVHAMCTDESGNLYAATSSSLNSVVKWNGNSWIDLGGPFSNNILTLCTDQSGNLYAAGNFTNGSGNPYVAKWDGSVWTALGEFSGLPSSGYPKGVISICTNKTGDIYATGTFTNTFGRFYVAKWNGNAWTKVGDLMSDAVIYMHCDVNGYLYANGASLSEGIMYVAKWDGNKWSELSGLDVEQPNKNIILSICSDTDGNIYVGGAIKAKNSPNFYVGKWAGGSWLELSGGLGSTPYVFSMCTDPAGNLYAAGDFRNASGNRFVAMYPNAKYVDIKEQQTDNNNITIFPNPASDKITIQVKEYSPGKELISVRITDVLGKILYEKNSLRSESTLDLSGFSPGLYLVSVNVSGRWHTSKIVKE